MLLVVTVLSTAIAVVMTGVAWRASRAERFRSAARVESLSRAIAGDGSQFDLKLRNDAGEQGPIEVSRSGILSEAPPAAGSRLGLALAIGAFAVTTAAAAAIVFSSESPTAPRTLPAAPSSTGASGAAAPLELVALDYERDGDSIIVRGVVRNPTAGVQMDQLAAVVAVVGADGAALSSARATVDSPALLPGGQSNFSVTVPAASGAARYRVSFRSGDHLVSHVDKRIGT